ncbi:putative hydrolase [Aeromicrobium marinum DSM 15272]|uniref:Hydrolase n=1 Tax=Aeromicrobium marinum DSM 15272 TaxID=585531 RepID=E2SEB5_9ACTN|nr:zinc-dependent metalloprotease [Aeromicrobium marinum]EFQ82842.1 putative hydrolase [Aeromicrobium marinum DSM 15272]
MSSDSPDHPENDPDDGRPDPQNPFAGTPMEQMFAQFGGGSMPDLSQLMGQMQKMFAPHEGSVNFDVAKDVARRTVAAEGPDPSPSATESGAVADAVRLAEAWLDRATEIPVGATTSVAWSRAEWIEHTAGTWSGLVEPIAQHVTAAMGDAMPEEVKAMAGPLLGMLTQAGGALFGQQVGQALGTLSTEVLSSTDIGLPLGPARTVAVLPHNLRAFGDGLEVSAADVMLHVVLRECAHHRLFHHAPWLAGALTSVIEEFGRGTRIDLSAIESRLGSLDPTQPDQIAEAMSSGMFEPEPTPEQQQALQRLELLLALIEGWVDDVVTRATADTMPTAAPLAEAMRRRRATGGPAEQTFASLVGLELRPRRLRDASNLWAAVRTQHDAAARDRVWSHPDLLPTTADLDDPLGFSERLGAASTDDFDAELDRLLDDESE